MKKSAKKLSKKTKRVVTSRATSGKSKRSKAGEPKVAAEEPRDDEMILLCVRGMALFPGVVLPISVGREQSIRAVEKAVQEDRQLGVILQRDPENQNPGPDDIYSVGTVADIIRYITAPDGSHHLIAQGRQRFRVKKILQSEPFMTARIEWIDEPPENELKDTEIEARSFNLRDQAREALQLLPQTPEDLDQAIQNASSPSLLADTVATFIELPPDEKQDLLETFNLKERLRKVSEKLDHVVEVLSLSRDIRQQTQGTLEKAQREYYLREQLKTIQNELGEGAAVEHLELRESIVKAKLPEEAQKATFKELARLEKMPEASGEYGMLRSYLEWITELPWSVSTKDSIDIDRARKILDEDHFGLEKVKRRILEFLAVRKLNPDGKSPILCLVGPPGVGKTSLGKSIARAMDRKFHRVSLGGVHDESEIRGHRRTYVGALPGSVLTGLVRVGANNPVFMFDEIDKLGSGGYQGDPSSALLEVLDPEQNSSFRDNYLALAFDLSKVMFVATANVLDTIPGPLRDRCEIIELTGYTSAEKLEIAKRYLVKRQLVNNGLKTSQCRIKPAALRELIAHYTLEAGCRNLEREIGALFRHVAMRVASGHKKQVVLDVSDVAKILGPHKHESELAMRTSVPGVATGLAWTPYGGHLLFVEATRMPGKGELILTGQLGDVMKESARAAISLVRSRGASLGIDADHLENDNIHIHVPAGSIPKDGPSAGVAMYTALVSRFTDRAIRPDIAMTGEISLQGHVLPIGGLKEKLIAAGRAGIRSVVIPKRNENDLVDVPEATRKQMRFILVETVDDVLKAAFSKAKR
ncbi:MAG: ATP-dependent Lon protease [Planctomycetota bacterium]|jgi:ATP-dependent Lon protease